MAQSRAAAMGRRCGRHQTEPRRHQQGVSGPCRPAPRVSRLQRAGTLMVLVSGNAGRRLTAADTPGGEVRRDWLR